MLNLNMQLAINIFEQQRAQQAKKTPFVFYYIYFYNPVLAAHEASARGIKEKFPLISVKISDKSPK